MYNKWYEKCWLWLMMIFVLMVAVVISFVVCCKFPCVLHVIKREIFWSALGSLGTVSALIFAVISYRHDEKIKRQQRTAEAYLPIREKYYELETRLINCNSRHKLLKQYLGEMEIFATGINLNAYSIEYINRISGGKLINQYNNIIKDFIENRKSCKAQNFINSEDLYCEYEEMIKKLYKMRHKKIRK